MYALSWKEKLGLLDRLVYRYQTPLETILLSFAPVRSLVQLVARRLFPAYELIRLDRMPPAELGGFLSPDYKPFRLNDNHQSPMNVIAVAKRR
jgi:hypothetical protein